MVIFHPICSRYGIFTYIYPKNQPNVGKYAIHGDFPVRYVNVYQAGYIYIYHVTDSKAHLKRSWFFGAVPLDGFMGRHMTCHTLIIPQMLHVWNMYLHLGHFWW